MNAKPKFLKGVVPPISEEAEQAALSTLVNETKQKFALSLDESPVVNCSAGTSSQSKRFIVEVTSHAAWNSVMEKGVRRLRFPAMGPWRTDKDCQIHPAQKTRQRTSCRGEVVFAPQWEQPKNFTRTIPVMSLGDTGNCDKIHL
jgi:hypothetical protein